MGKVKMQTMHLLQLLLYMKRWKFVWVILVIPSLLFNHVAFPIVDGWMGTSGQTFVDMGAEEFSMHNKILAQPQKYKDELSAMKGMLKLENVNFDTLLEDCSNLDDCQAKIFSYLYGKIDTSKFSNYVDYEHASSSATTNSSSASSNSSTHILCQMSQGSELNCPFLGNLAAVSQHKEVGEEYQFKKIRFFNMISRRESKKIDSPRGQDTMCAKHENFEAVFSRAVMLQCMLIVGTVSFYFLVSTQACISELKRDGFLQLMFQKGLSVLSYWLVISGITIIEVMSFTLVFIISISVQCPSFFNPTHLVLVFVMALFSLLGQTTVGVLFTVTVGSYFYVGLLTVLITILSMTLILINRLVISTMVWLKLVLLFIFPLGHFGEFVQGVTLAEIRFESLGAYNIVILLATMLLPLILSCVILHMDYTCSAGNGFRLPSNFFTQREFWSTFKLSSEIVQEEIAIPDETDDPLYGEEPEPCANVEPVTDSLRPLVRLSKLSKAFQTRQVCGQGTSVTVIKDMSALIYENHITAIIGHNGAGKTTLLNLLTGAEEPTTGRVSICGILATSPLDRQKLRGRLGICPQMLGFATSLTVEQTIRLTIVSCGFEWEDCEDEVDTVLQIIRLNSKRDHQMGKLSIGQQRKLAVAMALLGEPKVLFLDEPTSGLDPESRRRMWKLLQKYRLGRSIILSTQFMDEADTLADRKIFISGGSLICAGSSLFLKSAFDCGFVFEVTMKADKHAQLIKRQICSEFKTVKVQNSFGKNLNFNLPARDIDLLPALAQSLEKRMELISAFGLLQASLYDIFMRLKDLDEKAVAKLFSEDYDPMSSADEEGAEIGSESDASPRTRQSSLVMNQGNKLNPSLIRQLRAMLIVNVTRLLRTKVKLACRVVVPAILLVALIVTACVERFNENHKMHLRTTMTHNGERFKRAICVYDTISGAVTMTNQFTYINCALYLGYSSTSRDFKLISNRNFLALEKSPGTSLADFLQRKEIVAKIEKVCRSKTIEEPCPIAYTSNWQTTVPNNERTIYFGTYSTYENFNATTSASVCMGIFQAIMASFTKKARLKVGLDENGFRFTAESIYDYRSTFVPTLGAFFQMLILAFLPATFLDDIIDDKESKVRNQLTSMGMSCFGYWLTNFFIHWLQYAVIYCLSVFLLAAIVQTGYSSSYYMIGVFLPTLLCGLPSNQLMVYVMSTILNRSNHLVTIMHFFFSILLALAILIVQLNNVISIIMIALLPPFATVALTFYGTKTVFYTLSFYEKNTISSIENLRDGFFFSQPHVVVAFVATIVHAIVLLGMLMLIENRVMLQQMLESKFRTKVTPERDEDSEDPGVQEEMERVNENPRSQENIMEVRHLRKTYTNGTKVVRDVSFATGPAEVFGLLGPNGAGKTTTLSMVVGQLKTSGGRCELRYRDEWLPSGLAARKGAIGYCPQYDPLYDCISATEHLQFYANIMGAPKETMDTQLGSLIEGLGLDTTVGKYAGQLSVGNRRRLSLAISVLGDPAVIVIDEATTGVDPEGKRFLWQAIRSTAAQNCSVIVTTHSMEEVEAICNRVTVLNRGLMVGLGTVQQLRTRYGRSYSLEILIRTSIDEEPDEVQMKKDALIAAVSKKFTNTSVIEEFNDRVHFSIPVTSISRLSNALSWLLDNKSTLKIHYFSFHQMSMDQVFERMVTLHDKLVKSQRRNSVFSNSSEDSGSQSAV